VKILSALGTGTFTISGIAQYGSANTLAGVTLAAFTLPTAQRLMQEAGQLSDIDVVTRPRANQAAVGQAIARVLPKLFSIDSLKEMILEDGEGALKATSAQRSYERLSNVTVTPQQGNPEKPYEFELLKWTEMRDGITIPNIAPGHAMKDPITGATGGFQPERNTTFKKFSTRTMRPVLNFDTCIKCTLCWLQCPDSCFDVTPEQTYDLNADACCGCGICAAVCPVDACITMVNEAAFTDHKSQWERYKTDQQAYAAWVHQLTANQPERSHGFRYRGQYQEQIAKSRAGSGGEGGGD